MKRNRIVTFFFVLGLMVCFLNPTTGAAVDDYIDIDNPQLRKIPLALPLFVPISNAADELNMSRVVSDLFWETLEATGYFTMLRRNYSDKSSPDNQTSLFKKIAISGADFSKWIDSGAELLITGGILMKGDMLEIELRTYDLYKRTLLAGKKYKGQKKDYRKMVLRFCGDLIYRLTGTEWLFKTQIAFISGKKGKKDVYVCEFDGGNPERFTFTNSITLSPAWSSDAQWIAYTSYLRGKPDIFIRHFRENRGTVVSKKGVNLFPDWLPGKYAFAATLSYSGDPEIYLLTGEGKIAKRLTYSKGIDVSASWSPDGKQFAFVSDRSGTPQIYIKDARLNRVRRLTFQGKYNSSPNWSPRGDKVACQTGGLPVLPCLELCASSC